MGIVVHFCKIIVPSLIQVGQTISNVETNKKGSITNQQIKAIKPTSFQNSIHINLPWRFHLTLKNITFKLSHL